MIYMQLTCSHLSQYGMDFKPQFHLNQFRRSSSKKAIQ